MFALSLLSSLALAADPAPAAAPMTLTVPALGVTLVSTAGCDYTVVGTVPARKAGELAKALSDAKSRCLAAQERADEHALHLQMAAVRAPAEAKLIGDAGMAVATGKNVKVVTDGLTVESGSHLEWQAYGTAVGTGNPGLYAPGVYPSGGDPNLYRLSGGQMGYLVTPATPGQAAPAATAECGTAQECQKTIEAQSAAMAASDE